MRHVGTGSGSQRSRGSKISSQGGRRDEARGERVLRLLHAAVVLLPHEFSLADVDSVLEKSSHDREHRPNRVLGFIYLQWLSNLESALCQ